jgi:hypothetical protein
VSSTIRPAWLPGIPKTGASGLPRFVCTKEGVVVNHVVDMAKPHIHRDRAMPHVPQHAHLFVHAIKLISNILPMQFEGIRQHLHPLPFHHI